MPASLSNPAHVPGLAAWLRRSPDDESADLTAQQAAGITAWADIDTDLGHLDCYGCGICEPLSEAHGPVPAFDQFPPAPAEACTELGADTAPPRLGLLRRAHIALLQRRLAIVIDERDRYAALGAIGPVYEHNSRALQLQLMARIRELQGLPPLTTTGAPQ